jgi:pimeloyl-ACP methyl ester carboxylesterase
MSESRSLGARWSAYRPSKTLYFWSCLGCVAATVIIGFSWGGWETSGAAADHADLAVAHMKARLAANLCVNRFEGAADASAQFAVLKKTGGWQQSEWIEKGGWVTLPGGKRPVQGAADICVQKLLTATLPAAETGKTGG